MDELIECSEFQGKPSLEGRDFVDYFNLAYGTYPPEEFEGTDVKPFYEHDFKFIGFYLSKEGKQGRATLAPVGYFSIRSSME